MGMDPALKAKLQKQRYHIVGEHGGVKTCHWTKESLLRDRACYKGTFYGVKSHTCMQMSPVVDQCNLACTYCWREPHMDTLELTCLLYTSPSPRDLSTSRMPSSA